MSAYDDEHRGYVTGLETERNRMRGALEDILATLGEHTRTDEEQSLLEMALRGLGRWRD